MREGGREGGREDERGGREGGGRGREKFDARNKGMREGWRKQGEMGVRQ